MKQGDFGDTYYIILKGKTSVLINTEQKFEISLPFMPELDRNILNIKTTEIIEAFRKYLEKYEFIIDNENKQKFLYELDQFFPGVVKNSCGIYFIDSNEVVFKILFRSSECQESIRKF